MSYPKLDQEGVTGTPMSRLEFAVRLVGEALPIPSLGYDGQWLVIMSLLFNSAPIDYLLGIGSNDGYLQSKQRDRLILRTTVRRYDTEELGQGPFPIPHTSKVGDFYALRIMHFRNVARPIAMIVRKRRGSEVHPHVFVKLCSDPDDVIGDPVTRDDVLRDMSAGLAFMKSKYPVSHARYEPGLRSPEDFNKFLRWTMGPSGRETVDQLEDAKACEILEAIPRNKLAAVRLLRDLDKWADIVEAKERKAANPKRARRASKRKRTQEPAQTPFLDHVLP